ncbi:unnamed protein product [Zymoseptoria tritici ST99CH_3D7]|uniref:Uncharacterized protein n=2 Tax=Zymoseptoria tritici TaxID=1047171 RepID=A0A1X7S960_ZYMT9|nr:unnamed protein product [Zymoseptoria tritici ST99CH_3D7]SMR62001.1 unnamed protein product [Zymoseptoria tritici ST99CH_1E4]
MQLITTAAIFLSLLSGALANCEKADTVADPGNKYGQCVIDYGNGMGRIERPCTQQNPCQDTSKPCVINPSGQDSDCPGYPPRA